MMRIILSFCLALSTNFFSRAQDPNVLVFKGCSESENPGYCSFFAFGIGLTEVLNSSSYPVNIGDHIVLSVSLKFDESGRIKPLESVIYNPSTQSYSEFEELLNTLPAIDRGVVWDGKAKPFTYENIFRFIKNSDNMWAHDINYAPKSSDYNMPLKEVIFQGCDPGLNNTFLKKCLDAKIMGVLQNHFGKILSQRNLSFNGEHRMVVFYKINNAGKVDKLGVRALNKDVENEVKKVSNLFPRALSAKTIGTKAVPSNYMIQMKFILK